MRIAAGLAVVLTTLAQAAKLEFKETLKEVHASPEASSVIADFEFTNKTGKPVEVRKCESSCVCVAVKISGGKLHYAPGESGIIRAEFDLGNFSGVVDKMLALWIDKDPEAKPSVSLTVRAHIPVLVNLEPKTVIWDQNGKADTKIVKITTNHTKPVNVTSISCTSKNYKHELKTIEPGKTYELHITPQDTGTVEMGRFGIETDCEIKKFRNHQAFATIIKSVATAASAKP